MSSPWNVPPEYGDQPRRRHHGRRVVGLTLSALAVVAAGGALGAGVTDWTDNGSATSGAASPASTVTVVDQPNSSTTSLASLVKKIDPSVVSLTVTGGSGEDLGSGIVLNSTGTILTNNHVISAAENGGSVSVTFSNGKTVDATIVAADTSEDLAIVKAQGVSGLTAATLANSDTVQVGDPVVAIGNELGLPNSVSSGIVSALHRQVSVASEQNTPFRGFGGGNGGSAGTTYGNAIQTDAAINQGDSGGALFNTQGQVIGIDSAIATASDGSTGSVGIGFAIAINDAKAFITANS